MNRTEKSIELSNFEALVLRDELNEVAKLKLQIIFKAHINKIVRDVHQLCNDYEKMRVELVEKYGTTKENGLIEVDKDSDSYADFQKEMQELLNDKHVLRYGEIIESDFMGVETDLNFPMFFKLLLIN